MGFFLVPKVKTRRGGGGWGGVGDEHVHENVRTSPANETLMMATNVKCN